MAGSGHADCQNASPWYSCKSHALHRTAVKLKRTLSTAESPSASSAVETRLASCSLPVSARAFSTTAISEQTASMTAEIENRKAVWLTVTPSVRHRSSQNETMRMGSRKTLLGSSKIVHSAAHPRHSAVRAPPAIQQVVLGAFRWSRSGARQR